ncbi:hypothetical protein SAMN05428989_3829 [Pseudoxanthomonas sp. GM95]|uniref:hypothetical protein n=1 Tax=Pseudoxanthomonas sp. GM95 TaxID=1881043 RepID=UPI0008CE410D|nr:hypothetical protein [Pseudoxanthomonas sp. GM95]SEM42844.1 hypothetical protein SAMN05428989_3829 [Pseudoxanthomonas sp. GM95]
MIKPLVVPACVLLASTLVLSACKKPEPPSETTPAAAPAATTPPASAPAETPPAEPTAEQREAAQKQAKIQRALDNQKILDDPQGQWATGATASSTYATAIPTSEQSWAATQATGAPDAENTSGDKQGWSPEKANAGIEWLDLTYDKPVSASAVRVRQTYGPGAIIKVELVDEAGARHTVWEGADNDAYDGGEINWFQRSFDPTTYKAKGVRLTLATNAISNRVSIDAVQLVGQ